MLEDLPAGIGQDSLDYLDVVIEQALGKEGGPGEDSARLLVPSSKDELFDSAPNQGSSTHGAGFEGDVNFHMFQAIVR